MISVSVMAHPHRERWVPELVKSIDADVQVVWDQRNDRWDTGRRSWLAYDPSASHHLVVQDDAIVCRDLVAGLERAVEVSQEHPVGLYRGQVRPTPKHRRDKYAAKRALQGSGSWYVGKGPWWGPGILLPVADIPEMLEYCDRMVEVANYDRRISRYYEARGVLCWYTVPSLVEHRHGDENPSLIPNRNGRNRKAVRFLGRDVSALDVDWTRTASVKEPQ